jgi:Fe-S cluster biogenesis protein NfuA
MTAPVDSHGAGASRESFDALAARIDALRSRVAHADPATRDLLEETLAAITEFNRRGLVALVHALREDPAAAEVLYAAVEAPEVMALLVSHGIVRSGRTLDVLGVVEQIRPHLVAAGIEMSVQEVRGDVAYVQFPGGCSAPDQQVRDEIMGVLRQRVPGLREVVEVAPEPAGAAFVPLAALRVGPP